MIPKIIHLCWISGDPYPPLIEKCISSWARVLPDYQVMIWDSNRIAKLELRWVIEAVAARKYAFAADYIRLHALYYYGGIYLDSDVEVFRSFEKILDQSSFIGLETSLDVEAAVIGAVPGLEWIKSCLDYYADRSFFLGDEKYDIKPLPVIIQEVLLDKHSFQMPKDNLPQLCLNSMLLVCPPSYFSPKNRHTGEISIHNDTFCVHHLDGAWVGQSPITRTKKAVHSLLVRLLSPRLHRFVVDAYRMLKK